MGCGYGFLSCFLHLKSKSREIIGIDYDSDKVNIAQNYFMFKNLQNLRFSNQNILDAKLENPDVILLNDVLHYLDKESQSSVLINCFKNLNENGVILIREGEKDNNNHIFTKFTELLSTKIFRFNKAESELSFISGSFLNDLAKRFSFKIEELKHSRITSNKLFILRK